MTIEEYDNEIPQKNQSNVLTSAVHNELMKKKIEECLRDSIYETNELFELYDSVGQSFLDFDEIVRNQEKELKEIKEKRFHIPKPISTYRLEEKIDIFKSQIFVYTEHFKKISGDIKHFLGALYDKKVPSDEAKKIQDMKECFSKIFIDADKELKNRKDFLLKIKPTKK